MSITELENNIEQDEIGIEEKFPSIPVKRQLSLLVILLLLIFGTGYASKFFPNSASTEQNQPENIPHTEAGINASKGGVAHFKNITIVGEASFVWDISTQSALYKKNSEKQLPLASITKLMTALVAHEILTHGDSISITLSAIQQDGESGFRDGEIFSLANLTDFALMTSSNDAAYALATAANKAISNDSTPKAFVNAMNIRASELGLSQTYFRNPTGLDISETESGAYSSARDVALLMEYILREYPEILERTRENTDSFLNENGEQYSIENTNTVTTEIPGLIGSKTGYTELAGGNLVVAFDAGFNRPIVVVVLGSTLSSRFNDVLVLTEAVRKTIVE